MFELIKKVVRYRLLGIPLIPLALIIGSVAAAAITIVNQTAPAANITGAALTSGCAGTASSPASLAVLFVNGTTSTTGSVTFSCPGSSPAISTGTSGTVTPTFTTPVSFTDLYIVPSTATGAQACASIAGSLSITSGNNYIVGTSIPSGNYNYCRDFPTGTTSPTGTWTILWNQP